MPSTDTPARYLSASEFADRIGVKVGTLSRYKLPAPDVLVGTTRGWAEATVDAWHAARPGSGRWGRTEAPEAPRQPAVPTEHGVRLGTHTVVPGQPACTCGRQFTSGRGVRAHLARLATMATPQATCWACGGTDLQAAGTDDTGAPATACADCGERQETE